MNNLTFYKANSKNTGSCGNFFPNRDFKKNVTTGISMTLTKQYSWKDGEGGKMGTGSFRENDGSPEAQIKFNLSQVELAEILGAIERVKLELNVNKNTQIPHLLLGRKYKGQVSNTIGHFFDGNSSSLSITFYSKEDSHYFGMSLSKTYSDGAKTDIKFSLSYAEMILLENYIRAILVQTFERPTSDGDSYQGGRSQSQPSREAPKSVPAPSKPTARVARGKAATTPVEEVPDDLVAGFDDNDATGEDVPF